ncbi:hypothetical protein Y1Q_0004775 [Alligator mississippiensis]|uniref:Uncharacterized protein n=1 Tax=Alligator mississippiensis TaxID=8496 RepID=A0A151M440_ALLMI|nr:hypothetical protein Y1Q_0004775 [Alligator mississippiensis]
MNSAFVCLICPCGTAQQYLNAIKAPDSPASTPSSPCISEDEGIQLPAASVARLCKELSSGLHRGTGVLKAD